MSLFLAAPLPKGAEYLADVATLSAASSKVSPYLLLGLCYAESNFGLALRPPGPAGSGDYIPRPRTPERDAKMKRARALLAEGFSPRAVARRLGVAEQAIRQSLPTP